MKKVHVIVILAVMVALGVVISLFTGSETYSDFSAAASGASKQYQISGRLNVDKPILYNPDEDANTFSFYMADEKGRECKVICRGGKPRDFEKSEQIVITGNMENDSVFLAGNLLLKCPSKYNDEKRPARFNNKEFRSSGETAD